MGFFKFPDGGHWADRQIDEVMAQLPNRVKNHIERVLDDIKRDMLWLCDECESPIEQLLYIELDRLGREFVDYSCFAVHPQDVIACEDAVYRVDFRIVGQIEGVVVELIVECDGHDFHEKTKEQAARDKKKDRDLQREGYRVLRFTGSEIYRNPSRCATDVFVTMARLANQEAARGR